MRLASEYRCGTARRHDGYVAVMALAELATPIEDMTYRRAEYVLKRARSFLAVSRAAHQMLLLLIDNLTAESWGKADYLVWPSNATLAEDSGDGERSVRASLSELERNGLILRHYTRANRRMTLRGRADGGIDLAPLAARFEEIEAAVTAREKSRTDRRNLAWSRRQDIAREEVETFHLEQSSKNLTVDSVTDQVEPPARSRSARPAAKRPVASTTSQTAASKFPVSQNRSIRLERGRVGFSGSKSPLPSTVEGARERILAAYELSPRLCRLAPLEDLQKASLDEIYGILAAAVRHFMPARNTDQTWQWLIHQHGHAMAAEILVSALESGAAEPSAWLGSFAAKVHVDMSSNLRRLRSRQLAGVVPATVPDPATAATDATPQWAAILAQLTIVLGRATVTSWLKDLHYRGIEAGTLRLEARSAFIRDRVLTQFRDEIERAAKVARLRIDRVEITSPLPSQ